MQQKVNEQIFHAARSTIQQTHLRESPLRRWSWGCHVWFAACIGISSPVLLLDRRLNLFPRTISFLLLFLRVFVEVVCVVINTYTIQYRCRLYWIRKLHYHMLILAFYKKYSFHANFFEYFLLHMYVWMLGMCVKEYT